MADTVMLEEVFKIIDDSIARKKAVADAESAVQFTTAEKKRILKCVHILRNQKPKPGDEKLIYEKYMTWLEEWIMEKTIPKLLGKHGTSLLTEVPQSWSDFKAFADSIFELFRSLDRSYNPKTGFLALVDTSKKLCFCKLVCERLHGKIQEAAMSLVTQDREGKEIDRNLLKSVFSFFRDLGEKGATSYYAKFEQILLAETSIYYSELSMEQWFRHDSYAEYLRKVDWCMVQEEARTDIYPLKSTKEKVLMVMKYILLEKNAERWQNADVVRAEDEELVHKYTSLSLNGDISASATAALVSSD